MPYLKIFKQHITQTGKERPDHFYPVVLLVSTDKPELPSDTKNMNPGFRFFII